MTHDAADLDHENAKDALYWVAEALPSLAALAECWKHLPDHVKSAHIQSARQALDYAIGHMGGGDVSWPDADRDAEAAA